MAEEADRSTQIRTELQRLGVAKWTWRSKR